MYYVTVSSSALRKQRKTEKKKKKKTTSHFLVRVTCAHDLHPLIFFVCFTFRRFLLPSSSFYKYFSRTRFYLQFLLLPCIRFVRACRGKICSWPIPCASAGDRDFRSYPVMDGRSRMGMQCSMSIGCLTPSLMLSHCDYYYYYRC